MFHLTDASKFKAEFERCQKLFGSAKSESDSESEKLAENLEKLKVEESKESESGSQEAESSCKETDSTQEAEPSDKTEARGSDSSATEDTAVKASGD